MTDGKSEVKYTNFKYAEKIFTNFKDMKGFKVENGKFFPNMDMLVLSKEGDTVLYNQNLIVDARGYDAKKMTLHGHLILATPMRSGERYTLKHKVWDTKGNGIFLSKVDFGIERDETIKAKKNGLDFSEAYLMSKDREILIKEGKVHFNEVVLFNFQGLYGFKQENGQVELGMKMLVKDADGQIVMDKQDLFKNQILNYSNVIQGVSAMLEVRKGAVSNPLTWALEIWDKNSDAQLSAETKITVVN